LGGKFAHKNIIESSPIKNEVFVGLAFHYFTGGTVALTYPLFYLAFNVHMVGASLGLERPAT
jgi:hypothetical protein